MGRSHIRSRRDADPAGYGFALDELERPLDRDRLFGGGAADRPLEVEIGSGKGSFLIAESAARPDVLFLGVERARRYWLFAADRLRRRGRANARILRGDATESLRALPGGSVAALHIYFPDPWPKRRHAHRRLLLQPAFLTAVERALAPSALLRAVTDHAGYFEEIEAALANGSRLIRCRYQPPESAAAEELVGSNFERKYRLEGRPIRALAVFRSADGGSGEDAARTGG